MKADPSFMPDIEEVSDTPIASDLKFDIKSGANSGNKFDGSSLPGIATSVGTTLDEDMDRKFTGEDGFQDVGKAGASGGVRGGLKGAGAGFTLGNAIVPGIGGLVGAGAGLVVGGTYGAIKDVNQAKDANQQLAKNKASYFAGLPKMNSANPYKDIVRNGGFKLENGGDKSLNSFNGESHENGGIKLTESAEVEGGEVRAGDYIFSDQLEHPDYNGKTYADVAKGIKPVEKVFYFRPLGYEYVNRQGKRYTITEELDKILKDKCIKDCEFYADLIECNGFSEEHARDYLPQGIRQNFTFSANCRTLLHLDNVRNKPDAQLEIQVLMRHINQIMSEQCPEIYAWQNYKSKRMLSA
jgi:hypothetical protein